MTKNLTILILSIFFFQFAKAQKTTDTLLCFMKNSNQLAANKEDADYFMFIMPMDSTTKLSVIKQYYTTGKIKLLGTSSSRKYNELLLDGACITYYKNGKRESISNYKNGNLIGNIVEYYPNGKIYWVEIAGADKKNKLIECRDTSGNIITANGNGKWIYYGDNFKNISVQGSVKDSLKTGEWEGMDSTRIACISIYNNGKLMSGEYYDKSGKKYSYDQEEVAPTFKGGPERFNYYLARNVKYPRQDLENNITGKVIIAFAVEKDGSLTDVKVLRAPTEAMAEELIRVVSISPQWIPGIQVGVPVRVQFTITFEFSIANN